MMKELAMEIIGDINEGHEYMEYERSQDGINHIVIVEKESLIVVLENDDTVASAKVAVSDFLKEIGVEFFEKWINSIWFYCGLEK